MSIARWTLVAAIWGSGYAPRVFAQLSLETRLALEVQSAVDALSSPPTLAAWKISHRGERIDRAHTPTGQESYEVDHTNQWCATSVASLDAGVTRAASFYVPEVTRGALPPLPRKPDGALQLSCRLGAVWLETKGSQQANAVAAKLAAGWGAPAKPTRQELARERPRTRGSGFWRDVATWRRGRVTVWIAWTDWDEGTGKPPRSVIWILRDRPRDFDLLGAGLDTRAAAAKIANLTPALTAEMRPPSSCATLGPDVAVARLSRWLRASNSLPPERRAAALLVADSFVNCVQAAGTTPRALAALGIKLIPGCPQDGPVYSGYLREQAEALDPSGPAGALATLASLQAPCSLRGSVPFPQQVLDKGRQALRNFATGPSTPWVYFAMARALAAKLSFSQPPGEADAGVIHHLSALQSQQERSAAIAAFAHFIADQPGAPEAVFAWQEAWRLLAGLAPSAVPFGCGCE